MAQTSQIRTYDPTTSVVFQMTKERFGGLSNMAPNFPLKVNGIRIRTSEALYQACRFPHRPDVQRRIIDELSPMTAKMRSKAFRKESRSDWDTVRVKIMRWCLRVKLAQNWRAFSELLLKTGDWAIVEQSRKDDFWGAKPIDDRTLVGMNVLGQLLMELREAVKEEDRDSLVCVQPLAIPNFMLGGRPISIVTAKDDKLDVSTVQNATKPPHSEVDRLAVLQPSLFDVGIAKETPPLVQPVLSKMGVNIANLKAYPAMKDSGFAWLGKVPAHWEIYKLRSILTKSTERNRPHLPLLSVVRERGVILRDVADMDENHNFIPDDLTNYKVVHEGQFAMNKMKAWQGSYGVSRKEGIVSPAYFIFDINGVTEDYFHLAVRSKAYVSFFTQASDGVRIGQWDLSQARMREIPFLVPPESEQTAIVRFLDYADRRIRRYIRTKQKLIALLEEQKQAIIHQAVTGRTDVRTGRPYPAYKPSGVAWLGEVPTHWLLVPNRAMLRRRKTLVGEQHTEYKLLSLTKAGVIIRDVSTGRGKFSSDMGTCQEVRCGDLIFCLFDVQETPRTVGLSPHNGMITGAYTVFECEDDVLRRFLELFYVCLDDRKLLSPIYSGLRNTIPPSKFLGIKSAVPPTQEQVAILDYLAEARSPTERGIAHARQEIAFLNEYRTRLIADVVTGKLDVREAVAALPEVDPFAADDELDEPIDANAEADNDGLEAIPEEVEA